MKISKNAYDILKLFEGCPVKKINGKIYAVPYQDVAGHWTIGYGMTRINGVRVTMNTGPIPMTQVGQLFEQTLAPYIARTNTSINVALNPDQLGSLVSFAYNLGSAAFSGSTLLKRINACRWDDVAKQFKRWNMAGGKVRSGLIKRREAEVELFLRNTRWAVAPQLRACT